MLLRKYFPKLPRMQSQEVKVKNMISLIERRDTKVSACFNLRTERNTKKNKSATYLCLLFKKKSKMLSMITRFINVVQIFMLLYSRYLWLGIV